MSFILFLPVYFVAVAIVVIFVESIASNIDNFVLQKLIQNDFSGPQ